MCVRYACAFVRECENTATETDRERESPTHIHMFTYKHTPPVACLLHNEVLAGASQAAAQQRKHSIKKNNKAGMGIIYAGENNH